MQRMLKKDKGLSNNTDKLVYLILQVNDEFGVGVQIEGNVLRIVNAVVSDRGMYVCTAENAGGVAQTAAIVEVERKIFSMLNGPGDS